MSVTYTYYPLRLQGSVSEELELQKLYKEDALELPAQLRDELSTPFRCSLVPFPLLCLCHPMSLCCQSVNSRFDGLAS